MFLKTLYLVDTTQDTSCMYRTTYNIHILMLMVKLKRK